LIRTAPPLTMLTAPVPAATLTLAGDEVITRLPTETGELETETVRVSA
jgi:hypothetical protein